MSLDASLVAVLRALPAFQGVHFAPDLVGRSPRDITCAVSVSELSRDRVYGAAQGSLRRGLLSLAFGFEPEMAGLQDAVDRVRAGMDESDGLAGTAGGLRLLSISVDGVQSSRDEDSSLVTLTYQVRVIFTEEG